MIIKNIIMRAYIILLLLFCSFISHSQTSGTLTGRIKDNTGNKVDYSGITLSLLRLKDSGIVKLATSSHTGNYSFENIAAGKYIVSATSVGYKKTFSAPVTVMEG